MPFLLSIFGLLESSLFQGTLSQFLLGQGTLIWFAVTAQMWSSQLCPPQVCEEAVRSPLDVTVLSYMEISLALLRFLSSGWLGLDWTLA